MPKVIKILSPSSILSVPFRRQRNHSPTFFALVALTTFILLTDPVVTLLSRRRRFLRKAEKGVSVSECRALTFLNYTTRPDRSGLDGPVFTELSIVTAVWFSTFPSSSELSQINQDCACSRICSTLTFFNWLDLIDTKIDWISKLCHSVDTTPWFHGWYMNI